MNVVGDSQASAARLAVAIAGKEKMRKKCEMQAEELGQLANSLRELSNVEYTNWTSAQMTMMNLNYDIDAFCAKMGLSYRPIAGFRGYYTLLSNGLVWSTLTQRLIVSTNGTVVLQDTKRSERISTNFD